MRKVAIVGAGYISAIHADALAAIPGVRLTAIVDQNAEAAQRLARRAPGASIFSSVEDLIQQGAVDAAHVAVPPPFHRAVAEPLLRAGIDVLLEKPLAANASDAEALAAIGGAGRLGVNQNFVHHPAFLRLKALRAQIGPIEHVHVQYNVPLRQMVARQFGHWMFAEPKNILLEQAVHPLSQIVDLIGPVSDLSVLPGASYPLAEGWDFYPSWHIQLAGKTASADLQFAVGRDFPFWQIDVIGTDGVISADILNNRAVKLLRSRYPDFSDTAIGALASAAQTATQGLASIARYSASLVKIIGRSDPFFLSMKNTIAAFHADYPGDAPKLDGKFGADLVTLCERIASKIPGAPPAENRPHPSVVARQSFDADVVLLGGTGFIGTHLVRALLRQDKRITVLARSAGALPSEFSDPRVQLVHGDVHDSSAVMRAIGTAKLVVNLAQGASGGSDDEIIESMVRGASTVAECCKEASVQRLAHLSTIAALYLGDATQPIAATTPVDPRLHLRAVYARGKAKAEAAVVAAARGSTLSVVILRPGVVVGAGGLPFHSGLGFFNNEQHCLGWDNGDHPLPFVLAEDVASATASALTAPDADGMTLNLVGDVRLSARDYIRALGAAMDRPLYFHGNAAWKIAALEAGKWILKRAAGRKDAVRPTLWDIKSRGLSAPFDTSIEKRVLDWRPVSNRSAFLSSAIDPFRRT